VNTALTNWHAYGAAISAIVMLAATPVRAADTHMDHMKGPANGPNVKTPTGYRYELAGPIQSNAGKSIVTVRLVHDGKPVTGAIIIQSRCDMGPSGMAAHTAPIKALGEKPPGAYRFEIANGQVWNKPDNWGLSFSAKVQGVAQTVSGSLTVKLVP
jgi:hypothetical protein